MRLQPRVVQGRVLGPGRAPRTQPSLQCADRVTYMPAPSTDAPQEQKPTAKTDHGKVVNLMERAKQVGLTHLAIGTSGGGS